MSDAWYQRMQANCKIIWGNDCEYYDLDEETHDDIHYACLVKKDFGTSLGPPLTMTTFCNSSEAAWTELEEMLELWANQVQLTRGTPIVRQ